MSSSSSSVIAEKCRKELKEMMKDPSNKKCADCGNYPATWTSCNVGIFLCFRCSGIHRGLGVQISFVKSATLDDWNHKLLSRFKEQGGNYMVNLKYEGKLTADEKINESSTQIEVIKFIRNKYEKKIWFKNIKTSSLKKGQKTRNRTKSRTASRKSSNAATYEEYTAGGGSSRNRGKSYGSRQSAITQSPAIKPMPELNKRDSFLSNNELDLFYKESHDDDKAIKQQQELQKKRDSKDVMDLIQEYPSFDTNNNKNTDKDKAKSNILSKYHANNNQNNMNNMNMNNMNIMAMGNNQMNNMNNMNNMQMMRNMNGMNGNYNNQMMNGMYQMNQMNQMNGMMNKPQQMHQYGQQQQIMYNGMNGMNVNMNMNNGNINNNNNRQMMMMMMNSPNNNNQNNNYFNNNHRAPMMNVNGNMNMNPNGNMMNMNMNMNINMNMMNMNPNMVTSINY